MKTNPSRGVYAFMHVSAFFMLHLLCYYGRSNDGVNAANGFGAVISCLICFWVGCSRNEGSSERLVIDEGLRPGDYTKLVILPLLILIASFWVATATR